MTTRHVARGGAEGADGDQPRGNEAGLAKLYGLVREHLNRPAVEDVALALLVEVVRNWPGLTIDRIVRVAAHEYPNELAYLRSRARETVAEMISSDEGEPVIGMTFIEGGNALAEAVMKSIANSRLFAEGIQVQMRDEPDRAIVYVPFDLLRVSCTIVDPSVV